MENVKMIDVNPDNLDEVGFYCIKDKKAPGYKAKHKWLINEFGNGLKIKIASTEDGKQLGFIEYIPSEYSWRPISAENYLFIQCIMVYAKQDRRRNLGSWLIDACESDARSLGRDGICSLTSKGAWIADKSLFVGNGFVKADNLGRFELMYHTINNTAGIPKIINWNAELDKYCGWNLIYADQCPWHKKSVRDLEVTAAAHGIMMNIFRIEKSQDAQLAPSGYGTFSLVKDGKLLADHYISKTRFENILRKELT